MKKTSAQLKKDLDKIYSIYIRTKFSKYGMCNCYTCGKAMYIKEAHCGHFIPRNILITRWDEENTRPQCPGCNLWGNGKILDFEDHLNLDLGKTAVKRLKEKRFKIFKVDSRWYEDKIELYKKLILDLDMSTRSF